VRVQLNAFTSKLLRFLTFSFVFSYYSKARKEIHNFTGEAEFEKDKTAVWIKWPTQGRVT